MRRWLVAAILVAAGAVFGATASCRQVAGIGDSPEGDPTGACGLPYGTNACAGCAYANCCSESNACAADPACAPYESCLANCKGDPNCRSQCSPVSTASDATALSVCLATACETACGLRCGALAGDQNELAPTAADSCESCIANDETLCSAARACARSPDCDALNRAYSSCQTIDCEEALGREHGVTYSFAPDGGPNGESGNVTGVLLPFQNVVNGSCATPCVFGTHWQCAGKVSWAQPKSAATTIHFWVKTYNGGDAVPDAQVTVCGGQNSLCAMPFVTGMTNASGEVSLPFQNVANVGGQLTGLGVIGYLAITAPSIVTQYYYWGFPLSETERALYTEALSPSETQQLEADEGIEQDPTRGWLNAVVYDCGGQNAVGVQVTLSSADAKTKSTAPSSGLATSVTDKSGLLTFYNVPAGDVELQAIPMATGKVSSRVSANVRAGAATTVLMFPTP